MEKPLRIAVGMSGGVDSSYAACLLKQQGHQVVGLTMAVFGGETGAAAGRGHACYGPSEEEDISSARRVCEKLGIPHHTIDLREQYREAVLDYFRTEYLRGRTPNPCARCNPLVKFGFLLERAREQGIGFDRFATGHYARVARDPETGRFRLKRGLDRKKDQVYFLYRLQEEQLCRLLFPLGELEKGGVRKRARAAGLGACERPESQNFAEGGHQGLFAGLPVLPGPLVDSSGKPMGSHRGIVHYTVGQRRGIGIGGREPLYVLRVEAASNTVVVGPREELFSRTLLADRANFPGVDPPREPLRAQAQIRHNHPAADGELIPLEDRKVKFVFDLPQLSITPGQSAVFFQGDLLLGGGEICGG